MKKNLFKRCTALLAMCGVMISAMPLASIPVYAESNLIDNSTFDSGVSGWSTYKESGGSCSLSTDNGRLALKVSSTGKVNYAVQVCYDIIPLYQNGVYRLKYDISSSVDRYVEGMIQQNGGTYQAYTWKGLNLTSEPQTVDYEFTMEADTDIMAKMVFNCGVPAEGETDLPEHTIYLDNVSLELIDDSEVDYSATRPYEPDIMTNQVGYRPNDRKTAVFRNVGDVTEYLIINAEDDAILRSGYLSEPTENSVSGETVWTADFSDITEPGKYFISCLGLDDSYVFEIGDGVYNNLLDDSIKMLYLQRCGVEVEDET
ncbi:MAG: carbohydrate binding domain-containing protein, partial [Ruminococcus sp.]|nr:carbohydrate binding domain-containing protein [Ruminococcus sp.]